MSIVRFRFVLSRLVETGTATSVQQRHRLFLLSSLWVLNSILVSVSQSKILANSDPRALELVEAARNFSLRIIASLFKFMFLSPYNPWS